MQLGSAPKPEDSGRVQMVIERYAPIWGGAENQLRHLALRLAQQGVAVDIVTRRWRGSLAVQESLDGIAIRRVGSPGSGSIASLVFAGALGWHLVRARSPRRVIHTHGAAALGAVGALAARLTGARNVAKVATAGRIPQLVRSLPGRAVLELFKRSDAIIAMTPEIRAELLAIGTDAERIHQIPNGVDGQRFRPLADEQRRAWRRNRGWGEECQVVVFAGRLVHRKGVDVLLEAWRTVSAECPEARLVLLGSGAHQPDSVEPELRQMVAKHQLTSVTFEGDVPDPERVLGVADVFAFPSRREGFPNAILEAMSCGLAVVAACSGGAADIICPPRTGRLFSIDDVDELSRHLRELLQDRAELRRVGENARKAVLAEYGIAEVSRRYAELYAALLDLPSARQATTHCHRCAEG